MLFITRSFSVLTFLGFLIAFQAVAFSENTVILEFTSPTCSACRQMEPLVQQLIAKGYPIKQVDANVEPQWAEQLGVTAVPTFVVLTDGKVTERLEGVLDGFSMERRLRSSLDKNRDFQLQPASPTDGTSPTTLQPLRVQQVVRQQSPDNIPWIRATVRIRVESPNGHDWGTGTMIDARGGEVLILTCGHIFRDSKGLGRIEVDLYNGNTLKRVPGVCLKYDADKLDLALVKIAPQFQVDIIPVAPPEIELQEGMMLISTGCDNGANPTIREHRVRSLTNVSPPSTMAPFHFVQVDNAPVQGRSGGGLFTLNGWLVGVCVAGHSGDDEGLFVPASVVRQELDNTKLSCVYQSPSITRSQSPPVVLANNVTPVRDIPTQDTTPQPAVVPTNTTILQPVFIAGNDKHNIIQPGFNAAGRPFESQAIPIASDGIEQPKPLVSQPLGYQETRLTDREIATLEELHRRQQEGDEIIVIVRSKRKPEQPCEIIQLSDVSSEFLGALTGTSASPLWQLP